MWKTSVQISSVFLCSGLTLLSTIFQSYHDGVWLRQGAQCSLFYSAASLKYHAPATWYDTTHSHIILTLGQPVLALPLSLSAKRGAASTILNDTGMSQPRIEPMTSRSLEWTLYWLSYRDRYQSLLFAASAVSICIKSSRWGPSEAGLRLNQWHTNDDMNRDMTKPTKWACAQRRLGSERNERSTSMEQTAISSYKTWRGSNVGIEMMLSVFHLIKND